MERLLRDWRIILLLVSLAAALWFIQPAFDATGWKTNLQRGFDIQGGARAVLQPEIASADLRNQLMDVMRARLNVYGLTDIKIRPTQDLAGNSYILVEAAGMTEQDVRDLLAKQGKFEARIGNTTIFSGADIAVESYNSGVRFDSQGGYRFFVALRITNPEASQRFATVTNGLSDDLSLGLTETNRYLNETLDLYIDDKSVDQLKIASDLKGRVFTTPVVEGGAATKEEATKSMEKMRAILQTGALPVKIEVLSIDSVSPRLGEEFLSNTILAGILAVIGVGLVIFLRYRHFEIMASIMFTGLSEVILILGIASLIRWQLDLASIAGIIIAVGTGVDQQIIITDEILKRKLKDEEYSLREQIKRSGFIILSAFGTSVGAMLPLIFIGLGSVRGFAITTLLGLTAGMLITRPAYIRIIKFLVENNIVESKEPS